MASSEGLSLQGDLINAPSAALATSSLAQGLLRAVSADNVNPLALTQVQAIGACFQSNGDWAARAPDLLTRTPSARLNRLSAWIGWSKDDAPSFMSQTAGGRTASLLCLALGNLYAKERCGMILFDLSRDVLPAETQNSGLNQLGDVCMCLQNKLACLGFGNHLAAQLTHLRECFFESGQEYPRDLADTPTEEVMHAFLMGVRNALREENLSLYFSGSQCAGTLIALVLAICPEDVRVEVNGEMIMRGRRDTIVFSVTNEQDTTSRFSVEQSLRPNTRDFSRKYIIEGRHELNRQLSFSWDGFLSDQLDVAFAMHGLRPDNLLKPALATLVASAVITFSDQDWLGERVTGFMSFHCPPAGLRTLIGPRYRQVIQERLTRVLSRPSDTAPDFASQYKAVHDIVAVSLPFSHCTCGDCGVNPWKPSPAPNGPWKKTCPVAQIWAALGCAVTTAICCVLVQASSNTSLRMALGSRWTTRATAFLYERGCAKEMNAKMEQSIYVIHFHEWILDLVRQWSHDILSDDERPPRICTSSGSSTVYAKTLEFPEIQNPWSIEYNLVDGRLRYGSDNYGFIICASVEKGSAKKLTRKKASKSVLPKGHPISASKIGEHSSLLMTLRPAFVEGQQALILRCIVTQSTSTVELNFRELHCGLMQLAPANSCEHDLASPLSVSSGALIKATSVIAPVAGGKDAIGITLTQRNGEAQFLCCTMSVRQLYQGDCCISCAVTQAKEMGYLAIIGGSPSTYLLDLGPNLNDQEQSSGTA